MTAPLRSYQDEAATLYLAGAYKFLALDMGCGKTRVLIEILKRSRATRAIIVCPASVLLAIEAQFRQWWPESPRVIRVLSPRLNFESPGIYLINYDRLSRGNDYTDAFVAAGKKEKYDLIAADEAHCLKTPGSNRTIAVYKKLLPVAKRFLPMSGTPIVNHNGDIYSALAALAPDLITGVSGRVWSRFEFENQFCAITTKRISGIERRVITGSKNSEILRERLKSFIYRKTKKEILPELPPFSFVTVPIQPAKEALAELEEYNHLITPIMSDSEVLSALSGKDDHIMRIRAALGLAKTQAAIYYIQDFLADQPEDIKVVVWCEHHRVIDSMLSGLADYNPVKLDGRSNSVERSQAIQGFLEDPRVRVFVGNITAGGVGLTLIGPNCSCSDVFFVESNFVPGNNLQAGARVHRLNQNNHVLCRVFTAANTFDDRIQEILTKKANEIAEVLA